jgi:hypothetical protein
MSRITKVEGTFSVETENGSTLTLRVIGHGPKAGDSIHDLGPYVGRLVREELHKLADPIVSSEAELEVARLKTQIAVLAKANDDLKTKTAAKPIAPSHYTGPAKTVTRKKVPT